MKNAKRGLVAAVTGILIGIGLAAVVTWLVQNGSLPEYWAWLFVFIGVIGNLATLKHMRRGAVFYTIGWLAGAILLRDLLEPLEFALSILAPAGILALRVWLKVKRVVR